VSQHKKILYADDDLDDKMWVTEACKALNYVFDIEFVENGQEALQYLEKLPGEHLPELIVLDLNMPQLDGRQTLQRIKNNERYKNIPVIIVTTSSNKVDVEICKRLGAVLYLVKPDTHQEWQVIVQHFMPYITKKV
jgi:CheY-like chemotaxis protein